MKKWYLICADGINDYGQWHCCVKEENDGFAMTEKEMFEDVRQCLEEFGGGHADIWDEDTNELFAEIEV